MRELKTKDEAIAYAKAAAICIFVCVVVIMGYGLLYRLGG